MEIGLVTETTGTEIVPQGYDPGAELGKEEFMTLLLTQLQMQDPFEPLDNQDMIAQLAQFSSLEQLQNMSGGFQQNLEMDLLLGQLLNNTMATTMIGRSVQVEGNAISLGESGEVPKLAYRLDGNATDVTLTVTDENGTVVATLDELDGLVGFHTIEWDGRGENGESLPPGNYSFSVSATDAEGNQIGTAEHIVGNVKGVRYRDGNALLVLGDTEVLMSQVREVTESI